MSDWQPTEKQIEAACKGHARGMMPGVELDFDKMEDEVRDTKLWDAMKSALIAAHAAAEPVDTTEFDELMDDYDKSVEDLLNAGLNPDNVTWRSAEILPIKWEQTRTTLRAMYAMAATR